MGQGWDQDRTAVNDLSEIPSKLPEFERQDGCHMVFTWKSKYACSQCRIEQLDFVVG